MNINPLGVLETEARKFKAGHILRVDYSHQGLIKVHCEGPGCGFHISQSIENKEMVEYLAWQHRTEPRLLLPGTSDMLRPTRLAVVNQEKRR